MLVSYYGGIYRRNSILRRNIRQIGNYYTDPDSDEKLQIDEKQIEKVIS